MNVIRISKTILFALLAASMCLSCGKSTDVKLTINVSSAKKTTLYLSQLNFQKSTLIDSVKVSEGENVKKFRIPQGVEPTFYTVSLKNEGTITILAKQSENITLTFDSKKMLNYSVEGSEESKKVQTIAVEFAKSKQRIDDLRSQFAQTTDVTIKNSIQQEMQQVIDTQKSYSTKFIWENPMSKASVMAIYQKYNDNVYVFDSSDDLLIIKTVASAINALYPESDYAKGMYNDVKRIEKMISDAKIKQMISESETSIPDLNIADRNGKEVKLSSLKGKVVLLDFWHSNNTNSLMANREYIEIYNQYKSKGFEIYQVSLDSNRDKWIEALDTHKLPWINVCEGSEVSYAASIFNIQQIPGNYLLDRNQNIIGKNLFGNDLSAKLKKIL